MIDTHAHIDTEAFDEDRDEVIKRAEEEGVEYIIAPAINEKGFDKLLNIADTYSNVYCGIGIHPHNAHEAGEGTFKKIESLSENKNVVAIGEIGLDYYYDFCPKDVQKEVFRRQLQIAKKQDLPVIVHNRESDEDLLQIIEEEQDGRLNGVLHCFSSSKEVLERALKLGMHVSFTGNITFKKTNLGDAVISAPMEKIMIETDSPYMSPHPMRGKRNEPARVKLVAEKIAEYKSITYEEVVNMAARTAKKFFGLAAFLLCFLIAGADTLAQTDDELDEEYFELEEGEEGKLIHPYPKFIGIGPYFGTNTYVQTYKLPEGFEPSETFEGIFAVGGGLTYSPLDFLILELSYIYSKNTKISEEFLDQEPTIHQIWEISSHWTPNPYSRINFFGTLGFSYFFNTYDEEPVNYSALNTGLGFYINIPSPIGLFNVIAEWRLNFVLESFKANYITRDEIKNVDATAFFSIPRFGFSWYPPILTGE